MSPLPPTRERPVTAMPSGGGWDPSDDPAAGGNRTRRWLKRIGLILIVSFAVMLGAIAAIAFYAKEQIDDLVTPRTAAMRKAQGELKAPLPGKPANILLLGSDHRKSVSAESDKRSDTLLLVRLDPKRKTISMLSFPRDLYVPIPGAGQSKINDAYSIGGPAKSVETIKSITGLDINFVMNVDFTGFRGVVDQLGGVWVDVDRTYLDTVSNQVSDIDVKPGYQLLNGKDALAYARFRHDTRGDFNRIARQQQVISGLKKQVGSSSLARNIPGLFRVFRRNTEVVAGGGDSVDARVLYDYLRLALDLDGKDVYQIEYEGLTGEAGGASIVEFEQGKMDAAVKAFLQPSDSAREETADQLVGKQRAEATAADDAPAADEEEVAAVPDPSTVSVKVLNGSNTAGVARSMAQAIRSAGYEVDPEQTNADNANYANTKVVYATKADMPAAEALAAQIDGASVGAKDSSNAFSTKLLVIVGRTGQQFSASDGGSDTPIGVDEGPTGGAEYAGNKVPEKASAKVTKDAEYARESFLETRSNRFPIMYPTVYEQSSSFEEVYSYQMVRKVDGRNVIHDAYRLVAKTAQGDYWGLQGTSWPNPPILEDPTREVTRGARSYKLFFNGTKLHMVAWRQGSGTYWISNSVLDNLSNETMLAIADGVKVLR